VVVVALLAAVHARCSDLEELPGRDGSAERPQQYPY